MTNTLRYIGTRHAPTAGYPGTPVVECIAADGTTEPLAHVQYHSPSGFEWGYPGSGPADLALSILRDALDEPMYAPGNLTIDDTTPESLRFHQNFKRDVVARFEARGFELSRADILDWAQNERQKCRTRSDEYGHEL